MTYLPQPEQEQLEPQLLQRLSVTMHGRSAGLLERHDVPGGGTGAAAVTLHFDGCVVVLLGKRVDCGSVLFGGRVFDGGGDDDVQEDRTGKKQATEDDYIHRDGPMIRSGCGVCA